MNKFKRLQILGTTIIFLPFGIFGGACIIYASNATKPEVVKVEVVEETKPKTDTVIVVKEEVKKVSEPVVKKPVVIPTPQIPIVEKIEEVEVVKKDSVIVEVEVESDTTSQV
jgi:hypothetical protein